MNRNILIEKLENETREILLRSTQLLQEDPGILLQQPEPGRWSVAQVVEHLNTYGGYYLPLLENVIRELPEAKSVNYKPGLLGDYFAKSMLPKEGVVKNKMKTFKNHRPPSDIDSKKVLDEFIQQQHQLLDLMNRARNKEIGKNRIPISIAGFIKMKVGDTFRFVIAHHQRHFLQIENTLREVQRL